MKVVAFVLVVVAGCGSVSGKDVDARLPDTTNADTAGDTPGALPPAAVSAYGNATFAAATQTFTRVAFQTESYDDRNEYDPTTGRFTPAEAGDYLVCASVYIPSTMFEIDLYKNNVRGRAFGMATGVTEGCQPVRLAAGEYIEVWLYQYATSSVTIGDSPQGTWITISQITTDVDAAAVGSISVPNATFVKVPSTNEIRDTHGEYDDAQATFHAGQAADYLFCTWLAWNSQTYGGEIDLYVNGSREDGLGDGVGTSGGCRTLRLAANDGVDVRMYQQNGGPVTKTADSNWDYVAIGKQPAISSVESITTLSNVPGGTFVKIPYAVELFDDGGRFDIGSSTFTAGSAGDYLFCAAANSAIVGAANIELDLFKNGARERAMAWGRGEPVSGCRVVRLDASDQIDVRIWHDKSTAVTFSSDPIWWWFQASKIR